MGTAAGVNNRSDEAGDSRAMPCHGRRVRRGAVLVILATIVCGLLSLGLSSIAAASGLHYALTESVCPPPAPGKVTCYAEARVDVARGTPGANSFEAAAGATGENVGPLFGLTPQDLATAYDLDTSGGAGQTVAIVDGYNDPNIASDLQTFDAYYNLAACNLSDGCLRVVNQDGGATLPADDPLDDSIEETLDVETVHSICQGCKIVLVEASSLNDADIEAAENTAAESEDASVVSNSFGVPLAKTVDSSFASAFDHPGVVIVAASGDDGYNNFDEFGPRLRRSANAPAAYNNVVAVGGTTLRLLPDGQRSNELPWNLDGPDDVVQKLTGGIFRGATGGGCAPGIPAPSWQTALSDWASTGCGANRLVPDISAYANPLPGFAVYDTYHCGLVCFLYQGWVPVGGTSLAAPIIAGAFGLAGGANGVADPAETLYENSGSFYDVTDGGDGWCDGLPASRCSDPNLLGYGPLDCAFTTTGAVSNTDLGCDAAPGFDGASGLGTPDGVAAFVPPSSAGAGGRRVQPLATSPSGLPAAVASATASGTARPRPRR